MQTEKFAPSNSDPMGSRRLLESHILGSLMHRIPGTQPHVQLIFTHSNPHGSAQYGSSFHSAFTVLQFFQYCTPVYEYCTAEVSNLRSTTLQASDSTKKYVLLSVLCTGLYTLVKPKKKSDF